MGADALEVNEVCLSGQASANGDGNLWLWLAMFFMLALVVGLAVKGYFMLRQAATDLSHCWNQVADEDTYVATQESRINMLIQKCESLESRLEQVLTELKDEIQTVSNETNMVHDYAAGLHYSIVEHGGFLRNGLGLSHQQWVRLATLERANLVLARVMGSVEYMRGLRQRFVPQGQVDETDGNAMDTSDDGNDDGMPSSMQEATTPSSAESVSGMVDFLKAEHLGCLEREELWDANAIQRVILQFLEEIRGSTGTDIMTRCRGRISELFSELKDRAIEQNRWETADRYQMISSMYGPD